MSTKIIAIGREFGSGGHTIGMELAKSLGIGFYDEALIGKIAQESGYAEDFIRALNEQEAPGKYRFAYSLVGRDSKGKSMEDYVWEAECRVIQNLAETESFVIVGRCSDYLLGDREDTLTVFIHADYDFRCKRIVERYGETGEKPLKRIKDKDRRRGAHYSYFTGQTWGDKDNFDLCLNSGKLGVEKCVNILRHIVEVENA